MKSKEFITEGMSQELQQIAHRYEIEPEHHKYMEQIIKIGRECAPYLSQVQDPFELYRGIDEVDTIIKKRIRLDTRKPLGMEPETKELVDQVFTANFGAPFRNSALCTGEKFLAQEFGNVYIIFPIGNFKFLWSPDVEDLNKLIWRYEREDNDTFNDLDYIEDMADLLSTKNYTTKDINSAIESGHEIMIRAKGYYGLCMDDMRGFMDQRALQALLWIGMGK